MTFDLKLKTSILQKRYQNVLETIGNTPLIRLNSVSEELNTNVWAKVESFNPGLSAKDRIAIYMIDKAEKSGELLPGGTIIEATSGNTGFSIAMIAAVRGYKCILTVTDKISKEKYDQLKALGAEVIKCPKDADPDAPESYYQTAKRITKETENSLYLNQNYSTRNLEAHFHTTGKEIWEQTEGSVTHLVGSTGTGGTLCGSGMFLKRQNDNIKIMAVDSYGSVLMKYWETGIYDKREISSYNIEGTGKNIIPANILFDHIDRYTKVTDKDAAFMARKLALKEGMLVGIPG
jgi:cystathionine beta-synthase